MFSLCRARVLASTQTDGPVLIERIRVGNWEGEQAPSLQDQVNEMLAAAAITANEQS